MTSTACEHLPNLITYQKHFGEHATYGSGVGAGIYLDVHTPDVQAMWRAAIVLSCPLLACQSQMLAGLVFGITASTSKTVCGRSPVFNTRICLGFYISTWRITQPGNSLLFHTF